MNAFVKFVSIAAFAAALTGCAATQTMIAKKDLDVQSRTSTAIFVDPVSREKRTIYLDVKSGVMEFDRRKFKQFVAEQFTQHNDNGYRIVDDPEQAQFTMVAYVLNLEKSSPTAAQQALGQGYMGGAVLGGAALGAVANSSNHYTGAAVGGLAAGAAEFITGNMVKDVTYMLVCDVQIKERAAKGVLVRKDSRVSTKISDAGASTQTSSEVSNQKEYRTRIVTTANQANLELVNAETLMFQKTAYAMSGFF
jgi:outer membrane lipoprotein SlyB